MSFVHTHTLTVRHYECDVDGRVHPAVILRYLQESAFGASAAVGFHPARYEQIGLSWFAYETELEILRPLHYGDVITIRTWVADFRRVRSLRRYEVSVNDEIAVQASTDWVLIHTESGAPAAITPEIIEAYSRGGIVQQAQTRGAFPRFPKSPDHPFTLRHRVAYRDIDGAGHVNNSNYLHYAAEAERRDLVKRGWDRQRCLDAGGQVTARRFQIEYKQAALLDDLLEFTTWLDNVDAEGGKRYTLLTRAEGGAVVARVQSTWGWLDADTEQFKPLPDDLHRDLIA